MKKVLIQVVEFIKVGLPFRIRMGRASLNLSRDDNCHRQRPSILMENGFSFLLENGKRLLIEKDGTKAFNIPAQPSRSLILENGARLLLENGCAISLELTK